MAGPQPDADAVKSTSADGWTAGTPLDVLTDGRDAMFAVTMNGEPLPVEHGFPVRMVVPGLYGFVSATKWVVDVEVTRFDAFDAYWSTRGWSEQAPIKTVVADRGAPLQPVRRCRPGCRRRAPPGRSIAVSRPWRSASTAAPGSAHALAPCRARDTWRQWVWEWDAEPGEHQLQARAIDGDGDVQIEEPAPPAPDGATGWHEVRVEVET